MIDISFDTIRPTYWFNNQSRLIFFKLHSISKVYTLRFLKELLKNKQILIIQYWIPIVACFKANAIVLAFAAAQKPIRFLLLVIRETHTEKQNEKPLCFSFLRSILNATHITRTQKPVKICNRNFVLQLTFLLYLSFSLLPPTVLLKILLKQIKFNLWLAMNCKGNSVVCF